MNTQGYTQLWFIYYKIFCFELQTKISTKKTPLAPTCPEKIFPTIEKQRHLYYNES